jgi:hypothetical protein
MQDGSSHLRGGETQNIHTVFVWAVLISVYWANHKKHTSRLCGQNVDIIYC